MPEVNTIGFLVPWTDAVGTLRSLDEQDEHLVAEIGPLKVMLPLELHDRLKEFIGQRIGVLRTDRDYRFKTSGVRPVHA